VSVTYYPGCSLKSTAREYDESIREVFRILEIDLVELEDWNCCGATSAHSLDSRLALGLAARNLSLVSATTDFLLVPCAACYSRQKATEVALAKDSELRGEMEDALGVTLQRNVGVRNLLQFFSEKLEHIASKVTKVPSIERVACYYGCLLTRPPKITGEPNFEDPQSMEEIVKTLGLTPVRWSHKTECCGAALSITRKDIVVRLIGRILRAAAEAGAQAIVTACPLCQSNLDTRQKEAAVREDTRWGIPIVFITELMAEAFGSERAGAIYKKHIMSPTWL
jgi:heterodisulfide reductase subunit B